ncbi:MAG TPA: hypothetical protein DCP02_03100, partial [Actinobacteria bacterium]|nr:hypothetical protein [Actinomycetota bacterium]
VTEDRIKAGERMPVPDGGTAVSALPVILSLGIIVFFNFIEIGYFVYCVYLFNDYFVIAGSAVLVGYSIYSLLIFMPKVKKLIKNPLFFLTDRTEGYENILNIIMVSAEILFCIYILFKIFLI